MEDEEESGGKAEERIKQEEREGKGLRLLMGMKLERRRVYNRGGKGREGWKSGTQKRKDRGERRKKRKVENGIQVQSEEMERRREMEMKGE